MDQIRADHQQLAEDSGATRILDATPMAAMVLNEQRQIVLGNAMLTGMAGSDFLGLRPGEVIGCRHHTEGPDGCGTGLSCRFCSAVSIVRESQQTGRRTEGDASIVMDVDGAEYTMDLQVVSTPIEISDRRFYLVFLSDISMAKRKAMLEKSFFHDVKNTASGVQHLARYIVDTTGIESNLAESLIEQSQRLIEEITNQQMLIAAESGQLTIDSRPGESVVLFMDAKYQTENLKVCEGKTISTAMPDESRELETDPILLRRILVNLLKNALEASEVGDIIRYELRHLENGVEFEVANQAVMSDETRSKVFQRGYSTKGAGRGLGTFGSKLLTEQFLGGRISFRSESGTGTTFTVFIPYSISD